jgi:hypothetical protein
MADIDRAEVDFVVHLGDFKPGTSLPCSDELFRSRRLPPAARSRHRVTAGLQRQRVQLASAIG